MVNKEDIRKDRRYHYVMLIIDDYQINRLIHFFKFPVSRDKTIAKN